MQIQIQKYQSLAVFAESGLIAFTSPDGIHWEKLQEKPALLLRVFVF